MKVRARAIVVASLLLLLAPALLGAPRASADPAGQPPAPQTRLDQVVPTVMEETATVPVDLDGDGADEFVVLSRDGVAQRYLADGTPMWSTSYVEIAQALGSEPYRQNDSFWADFEGLTSCGSQRSVAFHDSNGDGTRDVFALLWLRTLEPPARVRTVVVQLDGGSGEVIRADPLMGRALAHAVADLDGDGRVEHVVVEEDGPPVTWDASTQEPKSEGSGATATVRARDPVTGETRWVFDTGATWPVTSGLVLVPRGASHDVVASLGGSNQIVRCTGSDIGTQPQRVVSIDGASGALRWETNVDAVAQDLIGLPDGGVVTWTDDAGGSVEVLEGSDGDRRWRTSGLGGGGVLGAAARAGDRLAVLSAHPVEGGGNETRLAMLDLEDGAVVDDLRLDGSEGSGSSDMPSIDDLRLAETGLAGPGEPVLVARTSRTVSAVTADASLVWQDRSDGTAQHVLFVSEAPDGDLVWTQGSLVTSRVEVPGVPASVGSRIDTGLYRLTGRSLPTGEETATLPLLANILGATRADVSGDGVQDRIFGGLGQVLLATDGVTGEVRWQTDLGNEILDVWPEDLDGDDEPDLLVEANQEAMGVRGQDGALLWRYGLDLPLDGFATGGGGAWRDVEVVDMTGDGVRDLVLGFRTANDEAWAPAGNAKVITLNGTSGAEVWRAELPPFNKGVNAVAVGDVTGDGVPDVAASVDGISDAIYYGVALFDGTDGSPIWAEHELTGGSRDTWGRDSVELVDHGDDGDLDVAVLTRDFNFPRSELDSRSEIRVHDGETGRFVASAAVPDPDVEQLSPIAMQTANFGAAGRFALVYAYYANEVRVRAYDPKDLSTRFAVRVPTGAAAWDVATGDLTGDGVADLAVPTSAGLFVADGAEALAGKLEILARTQAHRPLKGVLVDADGDGVDELETLETPAGWPLQIGPAFLNHLAGAVRSLGLLDLSP